jgi:uncharacterized protein (DUF58 family)
LQGDQENGRPARSGPKPVIADWMQIQSAFAASAHPQRIDWKFTAPPSNVRAVPAAAAAAHAPMLFDSAFLAKLEQLHLLARKLFRGEHRAERRSRQIGSSLEFADYRNYAWGDDPRTIDWAVYARLDRLFVKLFEQERDLDVHFLIDASASMRPTADRDAKLTAARKIAAALSYIALANLDRVNLGWFDNALRDDLGLTRGKSQFHHILQFLTSPPEPGGPTALLPSLRAFCQRLKRRGLVFLLSDFFDPAGYEEPLSLLRYNQFEVHLVQVIEPAELDPRLSGDLRLTECETGESWDVTATDTLVRAYRDEVAGYIRDLEGFCLRRGIGYALARSDVPFEDLVLQVLRNGVMLE